MADGATLMRAMARNNAWANHRLLTACAGLDEAALRAPRTGFFPSIALTLHHILLVDRFYIDALEGGSLGYPVFASKGDPPPFEELRAGQEQADRRLLRFCDRLDEAALGRIVHIHRRQHVQGERAGRVLLHLFQHQIHHRGQIHAMLAGTDVKPPQLDEFFLAEEAPLRAGEMAALGFAEDELWSP